MFAEKLKKYISLCYYLKKKSVRVKAGHEVKVLFRTVDIQTWNLLVYNTRWEINNYHQFCLWSTACACWSDNTENYEHWKTEQSVTMTVEDIIIADVFFNAFDRVVSMCCFLISLPFASLVIDVCSFVRGSV